MARNPVEPAPAGDPEPFEPGTVQSPSPAPNGGSERARRASVLRTVAETILDSRAAPVLPAAPPRARQAEHPWWGGAREPGDQASAHRPSPPSRTAPRAPARPVAPPSAAKRCAPRPPAPIDDDSRELLLAAAQSRPLTTGRVCDLLAVGAPEARTILRALVDEGVLTRVGSGKVMRYALPGLTHPTGPTPRSAPSPGPAAAPAPARPSTPTGPAPPRPDRPRPDGPPSAALLAEFDREIRRLPDRARDEAGFDPIRLRRMLAVEGGVSAAKAVLCRDGRGYGFVELWNLGHRDLTVEALASTPRFSVLFTADELAVARERLARYR